MLGKGLVKRCTTLVLAGLMTLSLGFNAFAADALADVCTKLETYKDSTNSGEKKAYEDAVSTWEGLADDATGQASISFAGTEKKFTNTVTDESNSQKSDNYIAAYKAMKGHLDTVGASATDPKTVSGAKSELDGMTNALEIGANVNAGQEALKSVAPLISRVTGIIVIVVLLGMAVFTAFDVAYLVFPVAKQQMDSAARSGNSAVSKTDSNTGEAKFRFVSDDAVQAYQTATESGGNPLFAYLKKRIISYIAVSIVVFILMTGNIAVIVNFILTMLESLFGMFGELTSGAAK